ncbi:MAG: hypothetical protein RLZZ303_885, partial [Candidatus Hydrogenedentota bacterium]
FTGEDCLVLAVGGGTNTGKSTLFNLLAGQEISPVRSTAAATCRPVVAANSRRALDCFEGRLAPGFQPRPLEHADEVLSRENPPEVLFIAECESLPPSWVVLDTPDVDSIDLANWDVAARLRAAGDIMLAVLTAEKYQDDRVVDFFREAAASGRVVLPIMNKANPANGYAVAREQLAGFCAAIGLENGPVFASPHDLDLAARGASVIARVDQPGTLLDYIGGLDPAEVKKQVYAATAAHFVEETACLRERIETACEALRASIQTFEESARRFARHYQPVPGAAVGGLFHEFVQGKRGSVDRAIGGASRAFAQGVARAGKAVRDAVMSRALLEAPARDGTDDKVRQRNIRQIEQISADLASHYIEVTRSFGAPAATLVSARIDRMDMDGVKVRVTRMAEQNGGITEDFRAHAERTLETWWQDHRGKRMVIEALDRALLLAPAGIAGVISINTAGVGVPEALMVAGPVVEQFAARVMEYQFGDQMFDFLTPWRKDQQEALERALREHVAQPLLEPVTRVLDALEAEQGAQLMRSLDACREALRTS